MKIKCSNCLKLVSESETDNCEKCDKTFCNECLIYCGKIPKWLFVQNARRNSTKQKQIYSWQKTENHNCEEKNKKGIK